MSIAGIVLICAWFFDTLYHRDLAVKLRHLSQDKVALSMIAIYAIHLLAMSYTSDWDYGLKDLRVKLPLLFLPLAVSTMRLVTVPQRRVILGLHVAAVLTSTLISYGLWAPVSQAVLDDPRDMVRFVSHIRLSLMIVMSIGLLPFLLQSFDLLRSIVAVAIIAWFLFFMLEIQAMTGIVILGVAMVLYFLVGEASKRYRIFSSLGLLLLLASVGGYLYVSHHDYFDVSDHPPSGVGDRSALGDPYQDWREVPQIEYNSYIWSHVAPAELTRSWTSKVSNMGHEATSEQEGRLVRYLNAMGLPKDATGVAALTPRDVEHILEGYTAPPEMQKTGLDKRMHELFYEWSAYWSGADPSGNSMTQRFEFWRTGAHIVQAHPIIGVGTGDVPAAFQSAYQQSDTQLASEYQLRAHNQYLTTIIAFGTIGGLLFIWFFFYPLFKGQGISPYTFYLFFLVLGMSFLTEDTLETQVGATLYAFYGVMIFVGVNRYSNRQQATAR